MPKTNLVCDIASGLGATSYDPATPLASATNCQDGALQSGKTNWDYKGEYWTLQDTGRGGPYYHVMPPNRSGCATSANFGNVDSFIAPGSFHPGGANVVYMDGSVKFIKNSVALNVWVALGSRAGGEVITGDAF